MEQWFCPMDAMKAIVLIMAFVFLLVFQVMPHVVQAAHVPLQQSSSMDVSDQPLVNNTITISSVRAGQDGWVAVFLDEGGRPGRLLRQTAVKQGNNTNVKVQLNEAVAPNSKVWPRFHIDAGTIGTFEFPGADSPGRDASGNVVTKQIVIKAASAPSSTNQSPPQLPATGSTNSLWSFLVAASILFIIAAFLLRLTHSEKK